MARPRFRFSQILLFTSLHKHNSRYRLIKFNLCIFPCLFYFCILCIVPHVYWNRHWNTLDVVTDMSVRTHGIQVRFMYHVFWHRSCDLEQRLRPCCRTTLLKLEMRHSSIEMCSKSFNRKYMLLYHTIYPKVSFSWASLLFTKAIQTYKYLIYLNMIIVNGMRYRISSQILSVPIWVILRGHDMYGCISTPVNMFIFIRNWNTNWKSCTALWQSVVQDLPYFPAPAIVSRERGLLCCYSIHIVLHTPLSSSLFVSLSLEIFRY